MEEQKLKMSQAGEHSRNKDIDSRTCGTNMWKIKAVRERYENPNTSSGVSFKRPQE